MPTPQHSHATQVKLLLHEIPRLQLANVSAQEMVEHAASSARSRTVTAAPTAKRLPIETVFAAAQRPTVWTCCSAASRSRPNESLMNTVLGTGDQVQVGSK